MITPGDIIKLSKKNDGKFYHDYENLPDASQFELLQLSKVALDLKNRLDIELTIRIQNEGDKTKEA